jgi:hypothetical protein
MPVAGMETFMDKSDFELAHHLFALALAKLEDATFIANRGQGQTTFPAIVREARQLSDVAQDLEAISGAIMALTHSIDTVTPRRSKMPR